MVSATSSMNESSSAATRSVLNVRLLSSIAMSRERSWRLPQASRPPCAAIRRSDRCRRSPPSSSASRRGGRRCARCRSLPQEIVSSRRCSSFACAATAGAGSGAAGGILGGGPARAGAEDQQLGQRVRAQPVGAVDAHAGDLTRRVQPGERRRAVDVGVHSAHHVVHDGPDGDQLLDRIDVLILQAQLAHERDLASITFAPDGADRGARPGRTASRWSGPSPPP